MVETRSSARKATRPDSAMTETPSTAASAPKAPGKYSVMRIVAAWAVHLYTGLGLPVNLYGVHYAMYQQKSFGLWLLCNWLAIFIDATDGTLARAVDIKKVIPGYDGAGLDNIIDYITFAFSPALALCLFSVVPWVPGQMYCAFVVLIAAGYQFCQTAAKTDEAFVGFPSYWNILIHYLHYLRASPLAVYTSISVCGFLSFVPFHFVYPSRTRYMRKVTLIGSVFWGAMMLGPVFYPGEMADLFLKISLVYPIYYVGLSFVINSKKEK